MRKENWWRLTGWTNLFTDYGINVQWNIWGLKRKDFTEFYPIELLDAESKIWMLYSHRIKYKPSSFIIWPFFSNLTFFLKHISKTSKNVIEVQKRTEMVKNLISTIGSFSFQFFDSNKWVWHEKPAHDTIKHENRKEENVSLCRPIIRLKNSNNKKCSLCTICTTFVHYYTTEWHQIKRVEGAASYKHTCRNRYNE